MRYCIPGELWNQIGVPVGSNVSTAIKSYISEIAYKLPSVTDVMMAKEFWHTLCEFAERTGALRESLSGTLNANSNELTLPTPSNGEFQRIIGITVDGNPIGLDDFVLLDGDGTITLKFKNLSGAHSVKIDVSVTPNINAYPSNQNAPLWFLKLYDRILVAGTTMKLTSMGGKAWYDEAMCRMNATLYFHELNRVTHGLITSGMRKQVLIEAESVLARQSQTTNTQTTSNTVG